MRSRSRSTTSICWKMCDLRETILQNLISRVGGRPLAHWELPPGVEGDPVLGFGSDPAILVTDAGGTTRWFRSGEEAMKMTDYRVSSDGTFVTIISDHASRRVGGSTALRGWSFCFKTTNDAAKYVQSGEEEGYTFEGKEFLKAA